MVDPLASSLTFADLRHAVSPAVTLIASDMCRRFVKKQQSTTGEQHLITVEQRPAFDVAHPSLIDVDLPRKP